MRLLLGLLIAASSLTSVVRAAEQPNIVIFLADDLGSADVPWRGSKYHMPNLDALAKESVSIDQCYVHPVCSPTRAALLSGRYASRFGVTGPQNERAYPFGTVTLASALKSVGYDTALTGKWHLGSLSEWGPQKFGFDYSYGLLAGGCGPYDHQYKTGPFTDTWHRNGEPISEEGHVTDLIAREAVKYVEGRTGEKPFLLYVPFTAVHIPIDEPQKYLDLNKHIEDEGARLHAADASHLDDAVGQVLAALDRKKLRDDTLVLFCSDNGGHDLLQNNDTKYPGKYPTIKLTCHNEPLRGYKGQIYEGGLRTAALVRWPGKLKPGRIAGPIHAIDWTPTFTKLAGYQPSGDLKWDGADVWPLLTGEIATPDPRSIYCLAPGSKAQALRHGDWKMIVSKQGAVELYNLADDVSESTNVAEKHPDRVAELKRLLAEVAANDFDAKVKN